MMMFNPSPPPHITSHHSAPLFDFDDDDKRTIEEAEEE